MHSYIYLYFAARLHVETLEVPEVRRRWKHAAKGDGKTSHVGRSKAVRWSSECLVSKTLNDFVCVVSTGDLVVFSSRAID